MFAPSWSIRPVHTRVLALATLLLLVASLLPAAAAAPPALAGHTADPTAVGLVGDLQSELGCAGDWDPSCAA
ncbi:MAG TPA: hypothetical protein VES19_01990, partial [Candidatus Limnocylindrales bacterium]|nr:hypothetical protein [Candidatus Limnocylindrales bacterium]